MKKLFAFLLLATVLSHCGKTKNSTIRAINPVSVKNLTGDLSLGRYLLTCSDSHLIASDNKTNKISIFNYNGLAASQVIGRTGRGPGEFNNLMYTAADGNHLYVADPGNRRIAVFNMDDWSLDSTITKISSTTRFAAAGGYLYLFAPRAGNPSPFMKVDTGHKDHKSVTYFGKWMNPKRPRGWEQYILLFYHHTVIAVSKLKPIVKFYNENGKLLSMQNLAKDRALAQALAYKKRFRQNPANRRSAVILFQDAAIFTNNLILNFNMHINKRKYTSNNYLVYRINGNQLQKVGAFKTNIHGGFTHTFCIHGNKLYSNGGSGGINIFTFDLSFLNNHK
ncbi:MAG TPA: 6-bladed beta-propeller [Balneolaceae bacterium]|nr:6-bladed beta-propeller [Balneolaceae bacterium]